MASSSDPTETLLIVDDEEPVRRTFSEWLNESGLGCRILTAHDAESALRLANHHPIDLAILDWHLGAGNDGLRLLEDLYLFHPDVIAIMVTGFAHQATPLDAMRVGVRDYLDKNQDLDRTTFLAAVRKQLEHLRPLKRQRQLLQRLSAFRQAVDKVLPMVRSAAVLNDPVPITDAVRGLLGHLSRMTHAREAVLLVRSYDAGQNPPECLRAYEASGNPLDVELVPFARSLAGMVSSLQQPSIVNDLIRSGSTGAVVPQPFEQARKSILALPFQVSHSIQAVVELLDRSGGGGLFTDADQHVAASTIELGTELLRQAMGSKDMHRVLADTLTAALEAGDRVVATLNPGAVPADQVTPRVVDRLRESLVQSPGAVLQAEESIRLIEAVRDLAERHGPSAVAHCIQLIQDTGRLLDKVAGSPERVP